MANKKKGCDPANGSGCRCYGETRRSRDAALARPRVSGPRHDPQPRQTRGAQVGRPGVEFVRADMQDPASLLRAIEGAYGVFGVQSRTEAGVEGEVNEGKNLVNAAGVWRQPLRI